MRRSARTSTACARRTTSACGSATWLRDVAKVLNRRLDPQRPDRALVILAKASMPAAEWNPILLWHITRDEFLLRDFFVNWLYPQFEDGVLRARGWTMSSRSWTRWPSAAA